MATQDEIKIEMDVLLKEGPEISKLIVESKGKNNDGLIPKYQQWYTSATKIVEAFAPDRLEEFCGYYLPRSSRKTIGAASYTISDFLRGLSNPSIRGVTASLANNSFTQQFFIVTSLGTRIVGVLRDVRGHLFAELQDAELQAAADLQEINLRAAGALAGVVLERHLQRVMANHKIKTRKTNPTISVMNDQLKTVYADNTWRKVQYLARIFHEDVPQAQQLGSWQGFVDFDPAGNAVALSRKAKFGKSCQGARGARRGPFAKPGVRVHEISGLGDIRNTCCHKKAVDPTKDEVGELIAGVNKIIKNIF